MKKTKEFTITKWVIVGTMFTYSDEDAAKQKYREMEKDLKSVEMLTVKMTDAEECELDWSNLPPAQ